MGSTNGDIEHADVLVVGGGPVGLVTAYQLARTSGVSVKIVEKHAKSAQDAYGRAITLFPRTAEMLDQLGLADELAQQCFACRDTVSYNAAGEEVSGRGWAFMELMKDTRWDFALVLRQKYQEEVFRTALRHLGITLDAPTALVDVQIDEGVQQGGYRVSATLEDARTTPTSRYIVKCKYLIGADGGKSTVRRVLGIPFDGSSSVDKWVRIDGMVKTDLPKPRTYCSIESPTHGNVLWVALDRGATRIGYAFTAEREKAYTVFDEAAAAHEAVAAVKPFHLEFTRVDWWTVYVVGQRVARRFSVGDCVFLAGDSCHTHSSGAAQGMNTGIHDAVNLAWKLSLVLRGQAQQALLSTYESERRPNVEKLIAYDKAIARLMTMQLPEDWTGDPAADPNVVLGAVMAESAAFSSGLGIYYEVDDVLNRKLASAAEAESKPFLAPGHRAPDVMLRRPGTLEPTRLHRETPNRALFHVIVFTGDATATNPAFHAFCDALEASESLSPGSQDQDQDEETHLPIVYMTIPAFAAASAWEQLGGRAPAGGGSVFYDAATQEAHTRYNVDVERGAVYVLRPDGWIGTALPLGSDAVSTLEKYFGGFLCM